MDIYILRDGQEIGPLSEETTQTLLKQGSVLLNDLAWRPGMEQWIPLAGVLYPTMSPITPPRPPPPPAAPAPEPVPTPVGAAGGEPATPKQKAFLSYMGVPFSPELTREAAALLVNDTMESPGDAVRLARWNDDRLRLHPDLFHAEIQARKDNRSTHFLEVAQREGADVFDEVTKAHTQVLVAFLDVQYPNWDATEHEATWSYLFPAIAEKFPQLVKKEWKGRLKYPGGPKVAPELKRRSSAIARPGPARSRLGAAIRGLAIGAGILIIFIAGRAYLGPLLAERRARTAIPPSLPADRSAAVNPIVGSGAPDAAKPAVAPGELQNPLAQTPSAPLSTEPLPLETAAPMAGSAATDAAPVDDGMNAATTDPNAIPSLPTTPGAPDPLVAQPRTNLVTVKPIEVQLRFGRAKLPPGTPLKFVAAEGAMLRVKYLADVIVVPVAATDYSESSPALAGPPPVAAPVAPPPPVPAAPPPTSLF